MTIDLIPNKYAHISTSFDFESESEDDEQDDDPPSLVAAREENDRIILERKKVEESKSLTDKELSYLKQYTNSMSNLTTSSADPATMKSALELYTTQRKANYQIITECTAQLDKLAKDASKAQKVLERELKKLERATREKVAAKEKKKIEREEKQSEKQENKPEKLTKVYRVRITIDLPAGPGGNDAKASDIFQEASLGLTYTTSSASWTPHYDLRLDTTNPALSTLTYRAHFLNRTFETWTNAHITLSTSQASFGGLNEKIPQMESWRVTLHSKKYYTEQADQYGLYSLAELKAKREEQKVHIPEDTRVVDNKVQLTVQAVSAASGFKRGKKKSGFGSTNASASSRPRTIPTSGWTSGSRMAQAAPAPESSDEEKSARGVDGVTLTHPGNLITHSTAGLDTYGFTTTYELPTPRTIPSSPLVRRHVIAEVPLPSLIFTHILIPKLKSAAFLKAKLTNTSGIPLLSGQAGLTLDGSFLGNLSFPRASPEETVVLELGVDQGLKVEYEQPTVKHGTQGMIGFGKEEIGTYKRMIRLTNTKGASVSLVVLDQIPVPQDERLKVTILTPKGLKNENDTVKHGVGVDGKAASSGKKQNVVEQSSGATAATSSKLEDIPENTSVTHGSTLFSKRTPSFSSPGGRSTADAASAPVPTSTPTSTPGWGKAKASLRKNGEVRWDVDLVKGGCVALGLEWECRMPNGEGVYGLS